VTVARVLDDYLDPERISMLSKDDTNVAGKLLSLVQKMCLTIDKGSNRESQLVADFLLKSIVRKYGISTFATLCSNVADIDFSWVMPKYILQDPEVKKYEEMIGNFDCILTG